MTPGPGAAWPPAESPSRLEERSRLVTHAAPRAPGRRPQFRAPPRRQDAKPGTTHFRPPLAGIGRATRGRFGEQTFIVRQRKAFLNGSDSTEDLFVRPVAMTSLPVWC
ncbi:unnamed protein product [Rangifer tarandus platyrhynchus]|uniref:Uncharacterized protein n=1 Tax=Rangifer tarandus platyrhynchus TaxID=3082113 RepID=A0AC59ZHY8_RANTA